MSQILEAMMVILFGCSWPPSILKSWRGRTAKGKSLVFLLCIAVGYVCGIASKILSGNITYVFFFYCLNLCMILVELSLYFRNSKLDAQTQKTEAHHVQL